MPELPRWSQESHCSVDPAPTFHDCALPGVTRQRTADCGRAACQRAVVNFILIKSQGVGTEIRRVASRFENHPKHSQIRPEGRRAASAGKGGNLRRAGRDAPSHVGGAIPHSGAAEPAAAR